MDDVNVNRLVTYVDQRDAHIPLVRCQLSRSLVCGLQSVTNGLLCSLCPDRNLQLTVEETMEFSLHCLEV